MDRNLYCNYPFKLFEWSLSARRAWIEIASGTLSDTSDVKSLSARRAWIEMALPELIPLTDPSLSARRAWIEIGLSGVDTVSHQVALRKESVDRNASSMLNA